MKLKKISHNKDYVRFSKSLTIEVNPIITAEVDLYGGLVTFESDKYGDVKVFEDPEPCFDYYVSGKKLKNSGFEEFYSKLFQGSFENFENEIFDFAILETAKIYYNHLLNLKREEKIYLLLEAIDKAPTFKSTSGEVVLYNQWMCNAILESLGEGYLPSKRYTFDDNGGLATRYGVLKQDCWKLYEKLKNEK